MLKWAHLTKFKNQKAIICDGSVRSGKTVSMILGFVHWAMRFFDGKNFGICGKTISSTERNIILPLLNMPDITDYYSLQYIREENKRIIIRSGSHTNTFFIFGGKDESSYTLVQGITLSGVLFDEVALMPKSFVDQAVARTLSEPEARYWFNCNPESAEHWFYKEWICNTRQKKALHLHFTMQDNPILSPEQIADAERLYTGVFYNRYIKGLWCYDGTTAYRVAEYYYSGREQKRQRTNTQYLQSIQQLTAGKSISAVIVDPSAASFIAELRQAGFLVRKGKNDVVEGIRRTAAALEQGKLLFSPDCKNSFREFALYRWDESSSQDRPIKENDHAMDDIRYFVSTILREQPKPTRIGKF